MTIIKSQNTKKIRIKNDYATVLNYANKKNYPLLRKAIATGFDVNQKNNWGISFFSNIVISDDIELIEICLQAGADPFYSPQKFSDSPFSFSLFRKKEPVLLLMLNYCDREKMIKSLNINSEEELNMLIEKDMFKNIPLVLKKIKKIISKNDF